MSDLLRIHIRTMGLVIAIVLSLGFITINQSQASWKDEFGLLRIGVLNTHPVAVSEKTLTEFSNFYASQLGIKVQVIRFGSLGSLMDAHGSGRVQYAIHSARSYATMAGICHCLNAIARPVSENGSSGFRSVLVIRDQKKSEFATGQRLRIGYSRKNSMSGWIVPNSAIGNGEISGGEFVELGSVKDVVIAYERGDIDGFFGWVPSSDGSEPMAVTSIFDGFYNTRLQASDALSIAWKSKIIPYGPHVVHHSLPDELSQELTDLLLNLETRSPEISDIIEPYFSGGFEKANAEDYSAISAVLKLSSISVPAVFDGKLRAALR